MPWVVLNVPNQRPGQAKGLLLVHSSSCPPTGGPHPLPLSLPELLGATPPSTLLHTVPHLRMGPQSH